VARNGKICEASRFLKELPADDVIFAGAVPAGSAPEVQQGSGHGKTRTLEGDAGLNVKLED